MTILISLVNLIIPAIFLWLPQLFQRGLVLWLLLGFALAAKVNSLLLTKVLSHYN